MQRRRCVLENKMVSKHSNMRLLVQKKKHIDRWDHVLQGRLLVSSSDHMGLIHNSSSCCQLSW